MSSQTFSYTGSSQTFTVPAGITSLQVQMAGGQGAAGLAPSSAGGHGAEISFSLPVTPGQVLTIEVGGAGTVVPSTSGAYPDGGVPQFAIISGKDDGGGGGGGGGSKIYDASSTLLAAAGGGGGSGEGETYGGGTGGDGGGTTGYAGTSDSYSNPGQGGTQTAYGAGGAQNGTDGNAGGAGTATAGGYGGNSSSNAPFGGSGGGGYFTGGGGSGTSYATDGAAGGGGGSSLIPSGGSFAGSHSGDGYVTLNWSAPIATTGTIAATGTISGSVVIPSQMGPIVASATMSTSEFSLSKQYDTGGISALASIGANESGGTGNNEIVPQSLPIAINGHGYMMDFKKSRFTTMQVRRQASDNSVEPGEQTLSIAGVWPRAQDNWFLGAGQKFLDNRFAFESVYVHSGEYPSVRTRFWKSQGLNPWKEGELTLHKEYASIATSSVNLLIVVCGNYLYRSDGASLYWALNVVGTASPSWTKVTTTNTNSIVSMTSDGSRVWFATGPQGVFVTVAGTTLVANAATPAALNGVGGLLAYPSGAGTVNATNLPAGSTTWYVSEVDAFGNETAAASVTATVASNPVNLNWNPDTNATNFNVYRGSKLVYTGNVPSFVDDGTVAGSTKSYPTVNGTGAEAYPATWILYAKGHLIGSTGRDLVEVLATGNISFIWQHENPNFVVTCGCESPSAILVGGYAGSMSFVGAIQPDAVTNGATLAPPTWATSMTPGEQINDIQYDAGAILLGTSLGIRSGTKPDSTGAFDVNPVIEDPGPVKCVTSYGQYMYFGWSNYSPAEPWAPSRPAISGLGRCDLSQYTTSGVPAYATDVMGASSGTATQVVAISGIPYFVVDDSGSYTLYGPDGKYVPTGWIEPGWIRYGTLESKIVVEVDFQHEPLPSTSSINYKIVSEDTLTVTDVGTNSAAGSTTVTDPLLAGLMVGDRFQPVITITSTTDQSQTPVFLSHITKAMVTTKRQDELLLCLNLYESVTGLGPASITQYFNVIQEYLFLKGLEGTGQVVTLQMGSLLCQAYIDQIMEEPDDMTTTRDWFMGDCTIKLITLTALSAG